MSLLPQIEAILFVASKPLSIKAIATALQKQEADIQEAIETVALRYNNPDSGIRILINDTMVQMMTNSDYAHIVDQFVKHEISEELTKAQLETLTIIAYRGPVTRPEIEQIRGVNCAVIIRNLLIRGLIDEQEEKHDLVPTYTLSLEAMAHLGITSREDLPEYESLHTHEYIDAVLQQSKTSNS